MHTRARMAGAAEPSRGLRYVIGLSKIAVSLTACIGAIMIEHSYPECTTSVITALSIFRKSYPKYRPADIQCASHLRALGKSD